MTTSPLIHTEYSSEGLPDNAENLLYSTEINADSTPTRRGNVYGEDGERGERRKERR